MLQRRPSVGQCLVEAEDTMLVDSGLFVAFVGFNPLDYIDRDAWRTVEPIVDQHQAPRHVTAKYCSPSPYKGIILTIRL